MVIIQEITLDTVKENAFKTAFVKQYDENSRFLKVKLTQQDAPIKVESDAAVLFNIRRGDGAQNCFSGEVNGDGTVQIPLPNWLLQVEGRAVCNVSVIGAAQEKLSTLNFTISVEKAPCGNDEVQQDSDYDILVDLIGEVQDVKAAKDEVLNAAEKVAKSVEKTENAAKQASETAEKVQAQATEIDKLLKITAKTFIREFTLKDWTAIAGTQLYMIQITKAEHQLNRPILLRAMVASKREEAGGSVIESESSIDVKDKVLSTGTVKIYVNCDLAKYEKYNVKIILQGE